MEMSQAGLITTDRSTVRTRACLELVILCGAIAVALWTDSRHIAPKAVRTATTVTVAALVIALLYRQRPSFASLGLQPQGGWLNGVAILGAITAGSVAIVLTVGALLGTLGHVSRFETWAWKNWPQDGIQQLLLQVLLVPRLQILLDRRDGWVSLAAAAIFALVHAPNPGLMILTGPMAWIWCEWFRRYPNLPAVWISHFLLALSAIYALNPFLGRLRVGIGYLWSSVDLSS